MILERDVGIIEKGIEMRLAQIQAGHLSNDQSSQLLQQLRHPDLRHVHLSQECNRPDLVMKKGRETLSQGGVALEIA